MTLSLRRWIREDPGQDLIEYALIGAFVALVAYTGTNNLGVSLTEWYGAMAAFTESAEDGAGDDGGGGGGKKSNCSDQGMESSGGKCHGG